MIVKWMIVKWMIVKMDNSKMDDTNEDKDSGASKRRITTALQQIAQAYKLPTGRAADGSYTGFEQSFWKNVDDVVGKTLIAIWRTLHSRYNEQFPCHVRRKWHHPKCSNYPPSKATPPSTPKSPITPLVRTNTMSSSRDSLSSTSRLSKESSLSEISETHGAIEESDEEAEEEEADEEEESSSRTPCNCDKLSRCFHLIGFDLLMDEKFNLHLLEVNNNPSMMCKISHMDSTIKQGVFESCLRIMGILTPKQLEVDTSKDGRLLQFFSGENLEDIITKKDETSKKGRIATPERTCQLLTPGKTFAELLRTVETGIDDLIDRL